MSTINHTRTRSTRLGGATAGTRPQSLHTRPPIAGTNLGANTRTAATTAAPATVQQTASSSSAPLSIFLTNLRLLDLDLLPEWPGISYETFAVAGSAAQGQKKRIKAVEWSLFQLFNLWDPESTSNKLKPFFPPLDQVQSINLRAAILRGLEQAKKDGLLGRDAILRKTTLDECRGERLEEVLASFSSGVLKKVVQEESTANGAYSTPLLGLALENRGYQGDRTDLTTLALVHRASLTNILESKKSANARYKDFSDFLGIKERGLARKREQLVTESDGQAKDSSKLSDDCIQDMHRLVRNNWAGNNRWMGALLHGDSGATQGGLPATPFDRVWRRVEQGRLSELEESAVGLLEQLDGRVRVQKERIQKWDAFRKRTFGERPIVSPSKQGAQKASEGVDLGFTSHESLQVRNAMNVKAAPILNSEPRTHDQYSHLVDGLRDGLNGFGQDQKDALAFLKKQRPRHREQLVSSLSPGDSTEGAISELSDFDEHTGEHTEEMVEAVDPEPAQPFRVDSSRRLPVRPRIDHPDMPSGFQESSDEPATPTPTQRLGVLARHRASPETSPSRRNQIDEEEQVSAEDEEPTTVSPTQNMADLILASMDNASPSPMKRAKPRQTLSLADRTRLSMARGASPFLADEEPELPTHEAYAPASSKQVEPPNLSPEDDSNQTADGELDDLASRTRRSMAGFEKAKQKAQMERRRSLRKSKLPPQRQSSQFPKVDEEPYQEQQSVIMEDIEDDDMEAIFKSRPKLAASPRPSLQPSQSQMWDREYN